MYLCVVELTFNSAFVVEELLDAGIGVGSDLFDKFFELISVGWSELPWMGVDGGYELSGGLSEEGVEFFQLSVHVRYGVHHFL